MRMVEAPFATSKLQSAICSVVLLRSIIWCLRWLFIMKHSTITLYRSAVSIPVPDSVFEHNSTVKLPVNFRQKLVPGV